jgi:LytS/YehU family sensor histidine kinase
MQVLYQTLDNMPRLIQVALQAERDTIRWSPPDTDHTINAFNRQTGDYTLYIRIFQQDGAITTHSFPITIRRFLWQQWWFWFLISSLIISFSFYLFYLHKQKQLAEAEAMRIKAEAEALRSEQLRQLTSMQVKSLSTQFRPHFILNALNTVGAQLYDKPEVDAVLGQLGDSIGIIFKNAQSGAIAHPLSQEWRLVMSVINIKQLELQNTVTVRLNVPENLLNEATIQVPMGILQIPVENALVHGLRNKETGPKDLWITATKSTEGELCVTILDNGIGRKAAAAMGNYRSNGVGTRNIQAILDLLNPYNQKPITTQYRDAPFEEGDKTTGTEVIICIPENYLYER